MKNNDENQSELKNQKNNERTATFRIVLKGIIALVVTLLVVIVILLSYKKEADDVEITESEKITNEENTTGDVSSELEIPDTSQLDSEKIESESGVEVVEPEISENEVLKPEVEETEEDEKFDFSKYDSCIELLEDMSYDEFKIVVWNYDNIAKAILSNGDSYEMEAGDFLYLYYPQNNLEVQINNDYFSILTKSATYCTLFLYDRVDNLELTCTAAALDGTEYDITVYITKDFEGDGSF